MSHQPPSRPTSNLYTGAGPPPKGNGISLTNTPYDFSNHAAIHQNPAGQYTEPIITLHRVPTLQDHSWGDESKPGKRVFDAPDFTTPNAGRIPTDKEVDIGWIPQVCLVAGCGVGGWTNPYTYQAHYDLHHKRYVCPEWRCQKGTFNGVFAGKVPLGKHHNESHSPESKKLILDNWWCTECHHHMKTTDQWTQHMAECHQGRNPVPPNPQSHGGRR